MRVTRRFDASPERVFDAWLDPARAGRWLFATPEGQMVRVEIDARVGGSFCFIDRRAGQDAVHRGEYLIIDRPRRLKFSFYVDDDRTNTTNVTIDITSVGSGSELTLTHERIPPDFVERTETGWTTILGTLAREMDG